MTSSAKAGASGFGLSPREKVKIPLLFLGIGIATALGFLASFVIGESSVLLAGLGIAAYAFGLRHGVDADHIVAIDNTTRKLMHEDKRPLTVGTWFSLGHSTVVFLLVVGLILTTRVIAEQIPALKSTGAVIGLTVSGVFLILIGLVNALIVLGIYRVFVELKRGHGQASPAELDEMLNKRGFLNRLFHSLFRMIREPWQIYPVGVLFGLGFDTATEIALITISVGVGLSSAIPIWMVLILPFMFTCGMVLVDTTDGITMRMAYGWAFLNPMRKVYYNLTVTLLSVLVAFGIGGIEILHLFAVQLGLSGPFWGWLDNLDFEYLGFGIIGMFVVAWLVSVLYWKYKGYDKWAAPG